MYLFEANKNKNVIKNAYMYNVHVQSKSIFYAFSYIFSKYIKIRNVEVIIILHTIVYTITYAYEYRLHHIIK